MATLDHPWNNIVALETDGPLKLQDDLCRSENRRRRRLPAGQRAAGAVQAFDDRVTAETDNVPLRKYGQPSEVAVAAEGLLSSFPIT